MSNSSNLFNTDPSETIFKSDDVKNQDPNNNDQPDNDEHPQGEISRSPKLQIPELKQADPIYQKPQKSYFVIPYHFPTQTNTKSIIFKQMSNQIRITYPQPMPQINQTRYYSTIQGSSINLEQQKQLQQGIGQAKFQPMKFIPPPKLAQTTTETKNQY